MTADELLQICNGMLLRMENSKPVYTAIADMMVSSAQKNFESEGRPLRWVEVMPATRKLKDKTGHNKILTWSGQLKASIRPSANNDRATAYSNKIYARIHQMGGIIKRKAGEITVRHRLTRGGQLMEGETGGAIFAKKSHKLSIERAFTHKAYQIAIPPRAYLVFQPGERESYTDIIYRYWIRGEISR